MPRHRRLSLHPSYMCALWRRSCHEPRLWFMKMRAVREIVIEWVLACYEVRLQFILLHSAPIVRMQYTAKCRSTDACMVQQSLIRRRLLVRCLSDLYRASCATWQTHRSVMLKVSMASLKLNAFSICNRQLDIKYHSSWNKLLFYGLKEITL